ncbi:MAG: hypothetical protein JSU73_01360 [candidate division WOR-3 bacterium]|nr:MAG: hypothetical protein JSU73_01360 [candidate division WOR-3 bacterium]
MRPLELRPELDRLVQRIRKEYLAAKVYGYRHDYAWPIAWDAVRPVLDSARVSVSQHTNYVTFLKQLVKSLRYEHSNRLAQDIVILVRRWRDLGLDLELLQNFVLIVWRTFEVLRTYELPEAMLQSVKKKGRPKRSYKQAMKDGAVPVADESLKQQQVRNYTEAIDRNREVSRTVSRIIRGLGVPGSEFVRYNSFAFRVDRVVRKQGDRTLAMEVANLVDQWDAKGLRREVLLAICRDGFRIEPDYGRPA